MDDSLRWIALREIPGLPRLHAHELLRRYGSPGQVFGQAEDELAAYCPRELARVLARGPDLAAARARQTEARAAGMRIVTPEDDGFPEPLRTIPDPPLALWVKGRFREAPAVAMVARAGPAPADSRRRGASRRPWPRPGSPW